MSKFRAFIETLEAAGDLLRVKQTVEPRFELGALLKQAEARRKAILFESVEGSQFPVVGSLLTSAQRFAQALGIADASFTLADHAGLVSRATYAPLPCEQVRSAACKDKVLNGKDSGGEILPVPTFFEGDSGPFLTAAVGISRNPDNGVINAGFYRVLMLGGDRVALNVSPASDLARFLDRDAGRNAITGVALAIGAEPALLMAAAAKVSADTSELEVAGALQGSPLQTVMAETSTLPVPANAEIIVELEIDHAETLENTMGEFGDTYGTQTARLARIAAITHRHDAVFHALMAGAGKEHNTLGMIILYGVEPELRAKLMANFSDVFDVHVHFDPPRLSATGEVYVRVRNGRELNARDLIRYAFAQTCGGYPVARIIRKIVLVDDDIDITSRAAIDWAISARATRAADYYAVDENALGGVVRVGVDARARDRHATRRLVIPGADTVRLDDYLAGTPSSSKR